MLNYNSNKYIKKYLLNPLIKKIIKKLIKMKTIVIIRTYFLIFTRLAIYSLFLYFDFKIFFQINNYEKIHQPKKNGSLNTTTSNMKLLKEKDVNIVEFIEAIIQLITLIVYIFIGLYYIFIKLSATIRWGILIYVECLILEMTLTRIFIRFKEYGFCKVEFSLILTGNFFGLFPFLYIGSYDSYEEKNSKITFVIAILRIFYIFIALLSFVKEATRNISFNVLIFLLIVSVISPLMEYYFPFFEDCDYDEECCKKKSNILIEVTKNDDNDSNSSSSEEEEKKNESKENIIINDVNEENKKTID